MAWSWQMTVVEDVRFPVIIFTPEHKGSKVVKIAAIFSTRNGHINSNG
jgi:hypothetical protein